MDILGGITFKSDSFPPFQTLSLFCFPQMYQTLVGTKFEVLPVNMVCELTECKLLYYRAVFSGCGIRIPKLKS